jgi:hypothetical protein
MSTFTADDAAQYVRAHPYFGRIEPLGPLTVVAVEFLTAAQLTAQHQLTGNFDPNRLLCYVEVTGDLRLVAPPIVTGPGTPTVSNVRPTRIAYQVFDAHTGNLLFVGGRA